MKKPFILAMYGVALFFVLKRARANGETGLPKPQTLAAPTYLYGILALTADFTGGLSVPLTAGLTIALIWQTEANQKADNKAKHMPTAKSHRKAATKPATRTTPASRQRIQ